MAADWRDLDAWAKARYRWELLTVGDPEHPRPEQLVPEGADWWRIALYLAGRGFGKTRIGAEDVSEYCRTHPGCRYAGVFADFGEGRDVGVEGESGILNVVPAGAVKEWNRSLGELIFVNGSRFDIYSSEKPSALRGPQSHRAWCDELAKWRYLGETWDMLQFGLRLGQHPRTIITTTPKPLGLLRQLIARPTTYTVRGSTFDNAHNLAPTFIEELRLRYEGTTLGQQEMYGMLLDDYLGALWQRANIDEHRVFGAPIERIVRCAVGIDPSTYSPELALNDDGNIGQGLETGIVTVGITDDTPPEVYVLEDHSGRMSGEEWGKRAVEAYHRADAIAPTVMVPEMNMAGPQSLAIIRLIDNTVRFHREGAKVGVRAAHGKRARAEPVATLYEQGRAHHVGTLTALEDQLCGWDPSETWSPDRLDALVWAITALQPWSTGALVGTSAGITGTMRRR